MRASARRLGEGDYPFARLRTRVTETGEPILEELTQELERANQEILRLKGYAVPSASPSAPLRAWLRASSTGLASSASAEGKAVRLRGIAISEGTHNGKYYPWEELSKDSFVDSFIGKPVVVDHKEGLPSEVGLVKAARKDLEQKAILLDMEGWRSLEVGGWHPVAVGLGAMVVATTLLFLFQEVLPALRLYRWHRGWRPRPPTREEAAPLEAALAYLHTPHTLPAVLLVDQEVPLAYAQGLSRPALVLSPPLLHRLDPQELAGVVAHELAHLRRRDNWLGWLLLALRAAMFYNPVALLVFRHILYDTERVCDDEAVALTGRPLALASGLLKVWRPAPGAPGVAGRQAWLRAPGTALGERSHQAILEDRLHRLLHPRPAARVDFISLRAALATVALVVLLFFVV